MVQSAKLLTEKETNGRLVSIIQSDPVLESDHWRTPYIELLQPKPTRENIDGIDCVFFVTELPVRDFAAQHPEVDFETKGFANTHHPYIELKSEDVAIKFHDRHFGAVVDLEQSISE